MALSTVPSHWTDTRVGRRVVLALLAVGVALAGTWSLFGAVVPLGPCGLGVLRYDERTWTVVHSENFRPQATPPHWQGRGVVTSVDAERLHYRDFSGTAVTFVPGSVNPTGCS